jgi:hypothetical protein
MNTDFIKKFGLSFLKYGGVAALFIIVGYFLGSGCSKSANPTGYKPLPVQKNDSVSHDTAIVWKPYPVTKKGDTVFVEIKGEEHAIFVHDSDVQVTLPEIYDTTIIRTFDTIKITKTPLFNITNSILGYGLSAEIGAAPTSNVFSLAVEGSLHYQKIEFFVKPQLMFGADNKLLLWAGCRYYFFRQ